MKKLFLICAAVLLLGMNVMAQEEEHEYAPIEEKPLAYKDWTYKNLKADGPQINLRQWAKGKKLVLVVYYAPWCGNWKNESPVLNRLFEKYKDKGFDVIAVNEYGTADEARAFFGAKGAPFPVVIESDNQSQRDKTTHFAYRQATGDGRTYGSPYNVFLEPGKLNPEGETVIAKTWIANGELIETEAEAFIRTRLGLEADKTEKKAEPEKEKSVSPTSKQ
ncbi:MAG: TlpA family protein disulfide reductase [Blastocatellia bacterium]|nr:TlpA family protein disulfide reductase [Blastocatellia bacterium]